MTWIYSQSTGILKHNGQFVAKGYAGKGIGKNDPKWKMYQILDQFLKANIQ